MSFEAYRNFEEVNDENSYRIRNSLVSEFVPPNNNNFASMVIDILAFLL